MFQIQKLSDTIVEMRDENRSLAIELTENREHFDKILGV